MGKDRYRRNLWPVIYGVLLAAYAVFALLDAFAVPRDLVSVEETFEKPSVERDYDTGTAHQEGIRYDERMGYQKMNQMI